MSGTFHFSFSLLVCPDVCSMSHAQRLIASCPPMYVRVNVLGSHNYPCFCMGTCPIPLTAFVLICLVYILFLWLHNVSLLVPLGTKGLLL